ncbi:hypothetical protein BKA69DRAFT_1129650 [Paraphysoderma sedebokerense]|nr:hypothetical protein BKA69DRAFT_1129650 [Paraphysoderma sedebokerense]
MMENISNLCLVFSLAIFFLNTHVASQITGPGKQPDPPRVSQNLFFEEQVPVSKVANAPPAIGRFLISGPPGLVFDATKDGIQFDQTPSCNGKSAKVNVRCPPNNLECQKLRKLGTIILVPCQRDGRKSARIMMVGKVANGDSVELDTNFSTMNTNGEPVAMSLDFSNSADYFKVAGLASTRDQNNLIQLVSKTASKASNNIFSDLRDKVKSWVDKARKVNIDQSTPVPLPIGPWSKVVIDETLAAGKCTSSSVASASASIKAEIRASGTAMAIFGIKVVGTVVPFEIKEAYVYVRLSGSAEIEGILDVSLNAMLSRKFSAPPLPFPGFGVEGLISVGPELNLMLKSTAHFKAFGQVTASAKMEIPEYDVYVGMAGEQSETDSMKSKSPSSSKLSKDITNSLYIDGTISFDAIPSLDIGIDALAGRYKATVGLQAIGDVQFHSNVMETQGTTQACFSGTAQASIGATGVLNSKQINNLGGVGFSTDPLELFRLCTAIPAPAIDGSGGPNIELRKSKLSPSLASIVSSENAAFSRLTRRNTKSSDSELQCLDFGYDIAPNTPFQQRYAMMRTSGYEFFDQCLEVGKTPTLCSSLDSKNGVGAPYPYYRLLGFHGTTKTNSEKLVKGLLKTETQVSERDRNQFGPGLYVTPDLHTAKFYAGKNEPQLLDVWVLNFDSMKGHVFPNIDSALDTIWFGYNPWTVAKSQPYVLDYDFIAGPHQSAAYADHRSTTQIKLNPKAFKNILITTRPWDTPAPSTYQHNGQEPKKQQPVGKSSQPPTPDTLLGGIDRVKTISKQPSKAQTSLIGSDMPKKSENQQPVGNVNLPIKRANTFNGNHGSNIRKAPFLGSNVPPFLPS